MKRFIFGAQRDRLEQGSHDEMEHRIREVLLRLVLPGEIFVYGRQVDAQRDHTPRCRSGWGR